MFDIRISVPEDLPGLRNVYAAARAFMAATGNPNQWGESNPREEILLRHMANGNLYVVCDGGEVHGAFAFIPGDDPTYTRIEGRWHSDTSYAAIHCVASDGTIRGMFGAIMDFCGARCSHLRIDTHRDNQIMQRLITGHGFSYCGIIHLENGSPRLAYERGE